MDERESTLLRLSSSAERLEERFGGLLDAAPDAMVVVDAGARIVLANGQAERLFGYEPGQISGRPVE